MRYLRSISDFFRSPAWGKNILLGGVAMLIPMIGPLILNGWHIGLLWMKPERAPEDYPPFRLDDIGKYLERALWPFVVSLLVGLVVMLPVMAGFLLVMIGFLTVGETNGNPPVLLFFVLYGMQFIGGILYYLLGTPFLIRATLLQKFDGVFDFRFAGDFVVKTGGEMLTGLLFCAALWVVLGIAGMCLCFVGFYFTIPLGLFATHHIQRQLYESYLRKGGTEIPRQPEIDGRAAAVARMKNHYSAETSAAMARAVERAWPEFPSRAFLRGIGDALKPLELKDRMRFLAGRLEKHLPADTPETFRILTAALAENDADSSGLRGFPVWPLTEIVSRRGLPHFPEAMAALREMTIRFTGEFAIRRFLLEEPEKTMEQLARWCADPNEHVRRLVSEGSRPFLPWGGNLPAHAAPPFPTLALLDKLHADESDYVRLSVANHLNDISRKSPEIVLSTLSRWKQDDARGKKLARHACRTLLKKGHAETMRFFGYNHSAWVVEEFLVSPEKVRIGDALSFSLLVRNAGKRPADLMCDYAIHYRKADGSLSPKVFKGRVRAVPAGETRRIDIRHVFRDVTIRKHRPGTHRLEIFLNGTSHGTRDFPLRR